MATSLTGLKHATLYGAGPAKIDGPKWDADHSVDDAAALRAALGAAPVGPMFLAQRSASLTIAGATFVEAILDAVVIDTDGAYNPATGRFSPARAGYYLIMLTGDVATSAGTLNNWQVNLYKNGVMYQPMAVATPDSAVIAGGSGTAIVYLNGTTDYVSMFVYVDGTSGTQSLRALSALAGYFIRE